MGRPHTSRRKAPLFSIPQEAPTSHSTRAPMGISPVHKGWSCCWMGSTANSDSSRVATSSEVCNWLICRLPITRTLRRMAPYIKNVRNRETAIPSPSFFP